MQDKLEKILKIKIDAINRNIDNLNYLNGELDKNNENLDYIKEMIALFKNNEVLNFDQISKDDFEKILLMIEPSITDIFKNKACSYDGIIYIIEGIRKNINLQLTEEQSNAILSFIEGMRLKSVNLQEVISNLIESKNRLPETDLKVLNNTLEDYENIVSKFENNTYLTEIDEVEEALDFSNTSVEEKVDLYEFLLKYNANIYSSKKEVEEPVEEEKKDDYSFELPTFNYEPLTNFEDTENAEEFKPEEIKGNIEYEEPEDYKLDLNQMLEPLNPVEENKEDNSFEPLPPLDDITFPSLNVYDSNEEVEKTDNNVSVEEVKESDTIPVEVTPTYDEIKSPEESHELNTVELEDIIKKIDARLKEMDTEEEPPVDEEVKEEVVEETNVDYLELLTKYTLPEISIKNNSVEDVDYVLEFLNDNKVLDELKNNKNLLVEILSNLNKDKLDEMVSLIKDNLLVKKDEFSYVLEIIVKTMPILLTKDEAYNSFKANLEFFKEHKINIINLFDNYRELLIMNNQKLLENYKKVEQYGLEINNDNVKYYLYNLNLLSNLDSYIEAVGYEKGFLGKEDHFDGIDYIKKNPYKLNDINKDTLIKLRYTSENGGKIYGNKPGILSGEISNSKVDILTLSEDYKNTYFNGEYSFIDRSEYSNLKEEITNLDDFDLTMDGNINKLDSSYKQGDLRYKFGNVLISRIKTIRLYNFLKSKNLSLRNALLIALTYNTVLKIEEYNEIEKIVDSIIEGGN